MEIFGIKFAPLAAPMESRLQTLAAAVWILNLGYGWMIYLPICIYVILFTKYLWIVSIYLLWIWVIDKNVSDRGGRSSAWVRSWSWWKYNRDYFPILLDKTPGVELDPKTNYMFCCFPHGMFSTGAFSAFGTTYNGYRGYFPHHTPHIATMGFIHRVPILREIILGMGAISASAHSIEYVLSMPGGGHICAIMIGGLAEMQYSKPGSYRLVLKGRKGFVKLALRNGSPLVPVLSFGETDLYDQIDCAWLSSVLLFLKKWMGLPPVIPVGRGFFQYSFGLIPHRRKINVVVGAPVDIPKIVDPTSEEIDLYHNIFIEKLMEMFETQKRIYLESAEDKRIIIE